MDVISWIIGLVAGVRLRSLRVAMALGTGTSIMIRLYQYFLAEEKWGTDMPEDLFGALLGGIGITLALTWLGSMLRLRVQERRRRAQEATT